MLSRRAEQAVILDKLLKQKLKEPLAYRSILLFYEPLFGKA
jgi:hypothetical protein